MVYNHHGNQVMTKDCSDLSRNYTDFSYKLDTCCNNFANFVRFKKLDIIMLGYNMLENGKGTPTGRYTESVETIGM